MPSPFPGWVPYPQRLGHQAGQRGAVRAQFSEGLHLAHLYQDPVGTQSLLPLMTPDSPLQQASP